MSASHTTKTADLLGSARTITTRFGGKCLICRNDTVEGVDFAAHITGKWLAICAACQTPEVAVATLVERALANGATEDAALVVLQGATEGITAATLTEAFKLGEGLKPAATDKPSRNGYAIGVWVDTAGRYVKVQQNKAKTGLYTKVWTGSGWEYAPELIRQQGMRPITAEEAATWGHERHACIFCSTKLEDDGENRSVQVGYGPICAAKYGLPWG